MTKKEEFEETPYHRVLICDHVTAQQLFAEFGWWVLGEDVYSRVSLTSSAFTCLNLPLPEAPPLCWAYSLCPKDPQHLVSRSGRVVYCLCYILGLAWVSSVCFLLSFTHILYVVTEMDPLEDRETYK